MKKIKTLLCGFAAMLLLLFSVSLPASAEGLKEYEYKDFIYEKWGGKQVYIIDYVGDKKKLVIPETLKGNKVVGVANVGDVKEVHYPDGIGIGVASDDKLKKITVNESNDRYIVKNNLVLSKDGTRLESCPGGIKNPKIPDSVKIIDTSSLGRNVTTLKLGKNVTTIAINVFETSETKLTKIIFNKKLKTIESGAFGGCEALKTVNFPESLKTIGDGAFRQCTSLKKVTIPKNVKTIGKSAFAECKNLKSIYIYNKSCRIVRGYYKENITIPKTTTIYGYKGSTAEKYAKRFGNKFVEIKKKK